MSVDMNGFNMISSSSFLELLTQWSRFKFVMFWIACLVHASLPGSNLTWCVTNTVLAAWHGS